MRRHSLMHILMLTITLTVSGTIYAAGSSSSSSTKKTDSVQQLKLAERLIYKENYAEAIKKLNGIVKKNKKNADAWNLLGFAARKSGDFDRASTAYEKALALEPDHLGALEYQGELFLSLNQRDQAESNLEKLTALCPDGCDELDELKMAIDTFN